jgi:hypothetical protein
MEMPQFLAPEPTQQPARGNRHSSHSERSFVTASAVDDRYDGGMKVRSANPGRPRQPLTTRQRAAVVPIETRIAILRHQRVILDTALAEIYGVPVKRLNQQVNRNRERSLLISCSS